MRFADEKVLELWRGLLDGPHTRRLGKALKKKAKKLAVTKVITFTAEGQGPMTYKKISGNKKLKINKTTGTVKVKKGLKKGTYKMKVKAKAAGNENYKASNWQKVTIKVKVK